MKTEPDNLSAKYLLLSTDDEQAFWRAEAAAEGVEFSLFVRQALNRHCEDRHRKRAIAAAYSREAASRQGQK